MKKHKNRRKTLVERYGIDQLKLGESMVVTHQDEPGLLRLRKSLSFQRKNFLLPGQRYSTSRITPDSCRVSVLDDFPVFDCGNWSEDELRKYTGPPGEQDRLVGRLNSTQRKLNSEFRFRAVQTENQEFFLVKRRIYQKRASRGPSEAVTKWVDEFVKIEIGKSKMFEGLRGNLARFIQRSHRNRVRFSMKRFPNGVLITRLPGTREKN